VRVGPIEEPLDGGASTHRWARESARGPAVVLSSSSHCWLDRRSAAAVRYTKERARVRREIGGR
jgi:hypothetical protein